MGKTSKSSKSALSPDDALNVTQRLRELRKKAVDLRLLVSPHGPHADYYLYDGLDEIDRFICSIIQFVGTKEGAL